MPTQGEDLITFNSGEVVPWKGLPRDKEQAHQRNDYFPLQDNHTLVSKGGWEESLILDRIEDHHMV